tara:strand:- start:4960 stop:5265 length:306 start_codon:yes stop_codon:yes gene_type:complete
MVSVEAPNQEGQNMAEIIFNIFNNSWSWVQVVMLITLLAMVVWPLHLILKYLLRRRALPPDTVLAIRQEGEKITVMFDKNVEIENLPLQEIRGLDLRQRIN